MSRARDNAVTGISDLLVLSPVLREDSYDEKHVGEKDDFDVVKDKLDRNVSFDKESSSGDSADKEEVVLVNGEPVITTGCDVSRFLVDTRDDGDPAFTFRSAVLGTIFAGLGAALCQVNALTSHRLARVT